MTYAHTPRIVASDDERWRAATALARAGRLLAPADMCAIFRICPSQYWRLRKQGAFDPFRLEFAIGRCMYSGTLVARYLDGASVFTPAEVSR